MFETKEQSNDIRYFRNNEEPSNADAHVLDSCCCVSRLALGSRMSVLGVVAWDMAHPLVHLFDIPTVPANALLLRISQIQCSCCS